MNVCGVREGEDGEDDGEGVRGGVSTLINKANKAWPCLEKEFLISGSFMVLPDCTSIIDQ